MASWLSAAFTSSKQRDTDEEDEEEEYYEEEEDEDEEEDEEHEALQQSRESENDVISFPAGVKKEIQVSVLSSEEEVRGNSEKGKSFQGNNGVTIIPKPEKEGASSDLNLLNNFKTTAQSTDNFIESERKREFSPANSIPSGSQTSVQTSSQSSCLQDSFSATEGSSVKQSAPVLQTTVIQSANISTAVNRPTAGQPQLEGLPALLSSARACLYHPAEFFVAWQGVLTVAYSGIPEEMVKLKEKINDQFGHCFVPENPGSKWPKTTLACLRDGKRLMPEQLRSMRKICSRLSFSLAALSPVVVDTLSVVLFENCCLEKTVVTATVDLQQPYDSSVPSVEQRNAVAMVVDEFSNKKLEEYWFHVAKDGNRSSHYRQSKLGTTIVHFLGNEIAEVVQKFRNEVEKELPGLYDWFSPESLHITLRAVQH